VARCVLTLKNRAQQPVEIGLKLEGSDLGAAEQWKTGLRGEETVRQTHEFKLPGLPFDKPVFLNLRLLQTPNDNLKETLEQTIPLHLAPMQPSLALDPLASHRFLVNNSIGVSARVVGSVAQSDKWILRWKQAENGLTSRALTINPTNGQVENEIQLRRPMLPARMAGEQLLLIRTGDSKPRSILSIDSLPVKEPVLRIVPQSIHHRPEKPTDGQTIFISFDVENIGNDASPPLLPALLDHNPTNGLSHQLPVQTVDAQIRVPPLGAGRRTEITLRWDPIKNAGVQKIWIDLKAPATLADPKRQQQIADYRLFVRTKTQLVRQKVYASVSAADQAAHRVRLHCVVANAGETDAHDVLVSFFKGKEKTPEQRLGQPVTLETIPARSSREAVLVWEYDPKIWTPDKLRGLKFTTEIRIKGSSQRLAEEENK
jgi:hypothetical protein